MYVINQENFCTGQYNFVFGAQAGRRVLSRLRRRKQQSGAARRALSVAIGICAAGTSAKVARRSRADVTLITIRAMTLSRAPNLKVAAICTVR